MGNNRLGSNSDVEKLARKARKAGFTVEVTRSNHLRWTAPLRPGQEVPDKLTSPLTFGDQRRVKAIKKFLIERGVQINL